MNAIRRVSQNLSSVGNRQKKENNNDFGEMNEEVLLQNVKEKLNITVKSSPSKDARSVSYISIKNGFAMKRNEQGMWAKRYLCMVPHMFLYYFDSEQSDQPKGIVDLHLYTNFTIEGEHDNILKLSIDDHDNSAYRSFYFEFDDPNEVSAWITMVHRERYQTVRDERDAYQQLQDQFGGQIDIMSNTIETCNAEKERLQNELIQAQIDQGNANEKVSKALSTIQRTLAKFGMTDENMSNTIDLDIATNMLIKSINDMKEKIDNQINESDKERLLERNKYEERITAIEKQLALEQQARKNLENILQSEKKEAEVRIRDAILESEKATLNMQMAVAAKMANDDKISGLLEEKKVLVKEVKQLRKKLESSNEMIENLKSLNDRLMISSAASFQDNHNQANVIVSSKSDNLPDIEKIIDNNNSNNNNNYYNSNNNNDIDDDDNDNNNNITHPSEKCSWEMPASSLKQLGWLSPEQLNLVEGRSQLEAQDPQPDTNTTSSKRQSFLSSMFPKDTVGDLLGLNDSKYLSEKGQDKQLSSSYFDNPLAENEERIIDKLVCLRCEGLVAGPKYSTCKCSIPALTPEDLSNSSSSRIFNLSFNIGGVVNAVKRNSVFNNNNNKD